MLIHGTLQTRSWRTPLAVALCAAVYLTMLYVAWRFDRATLYQARPPAWLRASVGRCQLLRDLLLTLRLRSVVLRIGYACPGHTMYSRTQVRKPSTASHTNTHINSPRLFFS